ncbi:hypothetical protein FIBSPDRAFT_1053181 [Athelia psychrophila]|uniref:Amino acid transporter transmembrane domain-containing protein n=1 Tax=Athelia psychrophila TaxID=1759441 RepID=A0A167XE77_9AGAM|nr:hypothetical protein FIBSPDRAFT_1053181 [Fibularhizoctonia sp. CBS 109695]
MALVNNASRAPSGRDPRSTDLTEKQEEQALPPVDTTLPNGAQPPFEAFLHYARIQRAAELADTRAGSVAEEQHWGGLIRRAFGGRKKIQAVPSDASSSCEGVEGEKGEKTYLEAEASSVNSGDVAYKTLRVASWQSVFYLITTDVLGPYSAPYSFAQVGYWPGCIMFFVFGCLAAFTGYLLMYMYGALDSPQYPVRHFGDLADRIFGRWAKHVCNILQSLQLIFNVGIIVLANGQGLSQITQFRVCFSVCIVIWTLAGMFIGQVRTLQKFGWLANVSVFMNIFVILVTMGVVSHQLPNYAASVHPIGPVITQARVVQPFEFQVTGILQLVFSYGGAMIFIDFMAEMRRPMDFWKGMACAQVLITLVYMIFGIVVYSYQGQFVVNPANQGISGYAWQTATNVISLTAGLTAAALWGNIGVKVIYETVLMTFFRFPPLHTQRGRVAWTFSTIVYWAIAFVIGTSIPQFSNISSLVSAICTVQFTYSFPPLLALGYQVQADAAKGDRVWDPSQPTPFAHRVDSWRDWSRWQRGLWPMLWLKVWYAVMCLASLATAGLGAYSAVAAIIAGFKTGSHASSFGCKSPVDVR